MDVLKRGVEALASARVSKPSVNRPMPSRLFAYCTHLLLSGFVLVLVFVLYFVHWYWSSL